MPAVNVLQDIEKFLGAWPCKLDKGEQKIIEGSVLTLRNLKGIKTTRRRKRSHSELQNLNPGNANLPIGVLRNSTREKNVPES